jgi:hypothetical protein
MAITAALCKLQNVIAVGSALNGGLMEKIPPQAVPYPGLSLYTTRPPSLTGFTAAHGLQAPGGEA